MFTAVQRHRLDIRFVCTASDVLGLTCNMREPHVLFAATPIRFSDASI
jgi:hypothetical protein